MKKRLAVLALAACMAAQPLPAFAESETEVDYQQMYETLESEYAELQEAYDALLAELAELKGEDETESAEPASLDGIFYRGEVMNDVTGRWRYALFASTQDATEYAVDYYNTYFESDDEIHAVINMTLGVTNKITVVMDGVLEVDEMEYVDGEEHDANLMFSGSTFAKYWIYTESGEVEDIMNEE